jgi:ATP-dependent DNA helicase Rep
MIFTQGRQRATLSFFMSAQLNLPQLQAVHHLNGPCLVLAGAGSGKTRVITHKIAQLIQSGVPAERIAAITFTNKAASEMRERARQLVGKAAGSVRICTFHALGVWVLRQSAQAIGLSAQFSIMDASDVHSLIKDAGGTTDKGQANRWQWQISGWKNQGLSPQAALSQAQGDDERTAALVYERYQERLRAYQAVDFDDLILLPLRAFEQHEEVRRHWESVFDHILVDEYQDTNAIQYEWLKLMVGPKGSFTAVGDDDQSIYGWRGATLDNLKRLPEDFPALRVIKLEQNYRSTTSILQAANQLIAPNPKLFPKRLFSELGAGEPVRILDADHEEHEADRVVARIQSLRAGQQAMGAGASFKEWKHFAVLYRANHQAKVIEQALRRAQIPYKVSGGQSFFERTEIRDLCSWFRLWTNQDDDPAFLRAVTTPKRGIGHQTLEKLGQFAASHHVSLFEALFQNSLHTVLTGRAHEGLRHFGQNVNDWAYRAKHAVGQTAALAFMMEWLKELNYEQHLFELEDNERLAASRWDNVLEFCNWMARRCGGAEEDPTSLQLHTPEKSLLDVAQSIALMSTLSERDQDQNVVTLSTLHAAKGLEWPHVMLVGVNEGSLPFQSGDESSAGLDIDPLRLQEERRLMYVGITRAQHTLLVSWCKRRKRGRELQAAQPSRFIAEMAVPADTQKEDPRAKLRALREEFAQRAAATAAAIKDKD